MSCATTSEVPVVSWQQWHIPWSEDQITLRAARESLATVGARQGEIPLLVQLVENPRYDLPGIHFFHGAVDLRAHDAIHILLGRGLLSKDEAFVIGFTMGSTHGVTTLEEKLYALIAKRFYPHEFRFDDDDIRIFKDAVRLGHTSHGPPLDQVNFDRYEDWELRDIRTDISLEADLILACYRMEQKRHPDDPASRRLLR